MTDKLVVKVALSDIDAKIETNPDNFALYADEDDFDYVLIKEKTRNSQSVSGQTNVAHNLGYVPLAYVYVEISTGVWRQIFSRPIDGTGYYYSINSTNLVLNNDTGVARNFAYYIFYDKIN